MRWLKELIKRRRAPVIPVIRLSGVIGGRGLGAPGLSAKSAAPLIEKAFAIKKAPAVALVINSPGGSPVQTSLIAGAIRRAAAEAEKPVLAFVEDVAASGGYWLACAADEIFIDPSSITGSIGVISAGFGFDEAIKKLGIERRLYTAGSRKSMLDPFSKSEEDDVAQLKEIQLAIHDSFKNWVRDRRTGKITHEETAFDGRIFVGQHAIDAGLVDATGHLEEIVKGRFGEHTKIRMINPQRSLLPWRSAVHHETLIDNLLARLRAEGLWQRYGL